MIVSWAIILAFASWRVTSLLFSESPMAWFRKLLGMHEDDATNTISYPDGAIGDWFGCFWCLSLIVSLALSALVYIFTPINIFEAFMLWLASSAGAIIIDARFFARYRG